ncbi:MAG: acyltransferase family protein [Pseudomonadota bacterium]|nr:acyltransferase family protein [Pseudomonadota bacterium]
MRIGSWNAPPLSVYRPLGDLCVKVFFMITAYLFVGKIIDSSKRPIDWLALFVSRVLRLTPLYLVAMAALLAMVGTLTHWTLQESLDLLLNHTGQWLTFTMVDIPDINRLPQTSLLVAGVTWSLAYEWLFYLSLPLLALVLTRRVPAATVLICTSFALWLIAIKAAVIFPWSFVVGAAAAVVARTEFVAKWLRGGGAAIAAVAALATVVLGQDPGPAKASVPALVVFFIPIACGNSLLGILTNRPALLLGEVSYGLYLLHGLLLTIVFHLMLGVPLAKTLSPLQHWVVVAGAGCVLVVIASLTFKWIERPCMNSVPSVAAWLTKCASRPIRETKA